MTNVDRPARPIVATAAVTIGGVSIQVHSGDLEVSPGHVHAFAEPRGGSGYRVTNLPDDSTTEWKKVRIGGLQFGWGHVWFGEEQLTTGTDRHGSPRPLMHCVCNVRIVRSSETHVSDKLKLGFVQNFASARSATYSDGGVISRQYSADKIDSREKRRRPEEGESMWIQRVRCTRSFARKSNKPSSRSAT